MKKISLLLVSMLLLSCSNLNDAAISNLDDKAMSLAQHEINKHLAYCEGYWYMAVHVKRIGNEVNLILFYKFKDLEIKLKPNKLTPADKANGIEWSGGIYSKAKLIKVYSTALKGNSSRDYYGINLVLNGWTEWVDNNYNFRDLNLFAEKKHGQWKINLNGAYYDHITRIAYGYEPANWEKEGQDMLLWEHDNGRNISCADIPKE